MLGTEIPPWLHITPETFTSAMRAGAGLGAELRGQDIQQRGQDLAASEAHDRLSLAYAQLQSQEERQAEAMQAKMALAHATLTARQEQMDLMNAFRERDMQRKEEAAKMLDESRTKSLAVSADHYRDMMKAKEDNLALQQKHLEETIQHHTENERMRQQIINNTQARHQLTQLDEFDLRNKQRRLDNAHKALNAAQTSEDPAAIAAATKELNEAKGDYEGFRQKFNTPEPIPDKGSEILAPSPWVKASMGMQGAPTEDLTPSTVGQPQPPASSGKRISVVHPDGSTGTIPEEQRDAAKAAGYTIPDDASNN